MATEEEQNEVLEILRAIQKSPAMNGEFNELVARVGDIKDIQGKIVFDLNSVMLKQEETHNKVDEIQKAMYNPDEGIYKRISDVRLLSQTITEDIEDLKTKSDSLDKTLITQEKRLVNVEVTEEALKKISGFNLQHLDGAIKLNNTTKRIFWAFALAIVALVAKEAWPLIVAFF